MIIKLVKMAKDDDCKKVMSFLFKARGKRERERVV